MTPQQNDLLCRVEADAPMGALMRQYWIPACMSEEVSQPDGPPVRARLLGENMVIFRDTNGRVGALDEHCPHRRASLAFGRNEKCGLRCLYHGWKMDVLGNVVEMPAESGEIGARRSRKARAFPTVESAGFVWVWMGDRERVQDFMIPAWMPTPQTKISIVKIHASCNWAQVVEGALDSAHSSSLHATEMPAVRHVHNSTATADAWLRPSEDKAPRIEVESTSYGFRYAAIRKPILNAETDNYVRTTLFIAPFTVLIPPNDQYNLAQMLVPIDDLNCMFYWIAWHETRGIDRMQWLEFCRAVVGRDLDRSFRKLRNLSNDYRQDRAAMREGDFTGMEGIPTQDMAMWESMGAIVDRSRESLAGSDRAVIQFRKQMLSAIKEFLEGQPAIGTTQPRVPHTSLRSFEGMIPKTSNWRDVSVVPRAGETE